MDPTTRALLAVIASNKGDHVAAEAHTTAARRDARGAARRERQIVEIAALVMAGGSDRADGLALEHSAEFPDDTTLLARITHPAHPSQEPAQGRPEGAAMTNEPYDVVVVGGGAAGLSAALVLGRARRRVAVVDAGAPRNAPAAHMQGYLSRDGMPPAELLAAGRAEVTAYGVEVVPDQVLTIEPGFVVLLASGQALQARRVLVTTGASDELPDIPGVRDRWGRDLLHCPYCHGWEVRDQPLGVLGSHPAAVQHAQLVRQWSDDVVFFVHTYDLTAAELVELDARGVQVVPGAVARLVVTDDRLTGVELADGTLVERTAVFIRPNIAPHPDGLLSGLGCTFDQAGFVAVDGTGATSVRGVWAAGNAADPRAQVITAAGAGSAAAIAINADLVQEDVERALR